MSDFSEVNKIFPMLAHNFLKILLVNPCESPQPFCKTRVKHVNLQLAQTPVFDDRCYQYTHSMCKVRAATMTHDHDDTPHAILTLLVVPAGM